MPACEITGMADEVAALMRARLRLQGDDLDTLLIRAGKQLPKEIRQEVGYIARAAAIAPVPALRVQLDLERLAQAHARCVKHFRRMGAGDRRTGYLLQVATTFAGGILTMGALLVALVAWRGLI